jgi:hypothetical protein
LVANTATFTADLGKAGNSLDGFGKQAQGAGDAMDFSMQKSRGAMMLMGEELGVHLPRELRTLIAEIPGIGVAMEALLPIMGIVFAVGMIEKYITKTREAQAALSEGFGKSLETTANKSDELRVSIAESKLKIDQLLGKPTSGDALVLEIAKAKVEADKLSDSLNKDLDGVIKLMQAASHGSIMTAILGTSGSGQAEDVAKGLKDALAKIPKDAKDYSEQAAAAYVGAWKRAQSEVEKNNKAHEEQMADAAKSNAGETVVPVTDFTAANTALQEFQEHLSAAHDNLDLIGKSYAFKKQAKDLGDASTAAKKDAEESKQWIEALQKAAKDRIELAKMEAKSDQEHVKLMVEFATAGKKAIDSLSASKQKEAEEWVKLTEKMIQEDTRHAALMADLSAKDGGASKNGENKRYAKQVAAYEHERQLLTSTGEQRVADEQKINNKEEEEAQKHENKMNELTRKGEQQRADLAKHFAQMTLFENKSMAAAMEQLGKQMLSELINNTIQGLMVKEDAAAKEKLMDAGSAARGAYTGVMDMNLPPMVGFPLAIASGAAAFAGVMAFAQGGEVPGSGMGDTVPAMLTPGETVVTKALTEQVKGSTGAGRGTTVHFAPVIHAIDSNGVEAMLTKHAATFERHVTSTIRKANRR